MFTLGAFVRISSVLFFIFTWSLYQRNWYAIDGGENLLMILTIYLMFADLRFLSIDGSVSRRISSESAKMDFRHAAQFRDYGLPDTDCNSILCLWVLQSPRSRLGEWHGLVLHTSDKRVLTTWIHRLAYSIRSLGHDWYLRDDRVRADASMAALASATKVSGLRWSRSDVAPVNESE